MSKVKFLYSLFMVSTLIFALYVIFLNFKPYFGKIDFFTVQKVEFVGLKRVNAKKLLEILDIKAGSSLVFINKGRLKKKIEADGRIRVLSIDRELPETLKVTVSEREGEFLLFDEGVFYEISRDCRVVCKGDDIYNYNKPVIVLSSGFAKEIDKTNSYCNLIDSLESLPQKERDLIDIISEVDLSVDYVLYPREPKLAINLGMRVDGEKMRRARYALLALNSKSSYRKYNYIDLRFNDSPVLFGKY